MVGSIGFVGVGRMGSEIARNLLDDGRDVVVYDIDEEQVAKMEAAGAQSMSLPDLVRETEVVMTSLTDESIISTVYLGDDGILAHASDGMTLVELSTVPPATVSAIQDNAMDGGPDVDVVDAPVIGVPDTAKAGELTVLVGCADAVFDCIEPVRAPLASDTCHIGTVGQGKAMKLANNAMIYGSLAVAAEAFALAQRFGIDAETFFDVVSSGAASSAILDIKGSKALRGNSEPGFPIDEARKDISYIVDLGHTTGTPIQTLATMGQLYTLSSWLGYGDVDYSALLSLLDTPQK